MLGLAVNGTGFVAEYDPKNAFSFRFGVQQSNPDATSLSDSIYSLAEVGYTVTPFSLPEGHYRLWFRANNGDVESKQAVGISLDQKLIAGRDACSAATARRTCLATTRDQLLRAPASASATGSCSIRSTRGASATRRWISRRATRKT